MATRNAATVQLNEIVRTDGQKSPEGIATIAAKYAEHFHRDGNSYRSAQYPDRIEFVDRKDRMHAYGKASAFTVRAMVETAQERGWSSLEVKGRNSVFKSMVFVEATSRGIPVTGHQPSAQDKAAVERRQTREAALANPKVQAFLNAKSGAEQTAAAKKHPELKEAFAAQAAGLAAIKESGAKGDDAAELVGNLNDKIARRIHTGQPMPQVTVATQHRLQEVERD